MQPWKASAYKIASDCGMDDPPNWFEEFISRWNSEAEKTGFEAGRQRAAMDAEKKIRVYRKKYAKVNEFIAKNEREGKDASHYKIMALAEGRCVGGGEGVRDTILRCAKELDPRMTQNMQFTMAGAFVILNDGGEFTMAHSDHPSVQIGAVQYLTLDDAAARFGQDRNELKEALFGVVQQQKAA